MAYTRPTLTVQNFVKVAKSSCKFYQVRADLHNRRITVTYGKLGTKGVERTFSFETRDEAREYLDTILERRYVNGYTRLLENLRVA